MPDGRVAVAVTTYAGSTLLGSGCVADDTGAEMIAVNLAETPEYRTLAETTYPDCPTADSACDPTHACNSGM